MNRKMIQGIKRGKGMSKRFLAVVRPDVPWDPVLEVINIFDEHFDESRTAYPLNSPNVR